MSLPGAADVPGPVVFDEGVRTSIQRRYGRLNEHVRPALHAAAVDPARSLFRAWLDNEVGRLEEAVRPGVLSRLRSEDGHFAALAEVASLALLRDAAGFTVALDPPIDGLTPDLLARHAASGEPALLAEVWSRAVPADAVKAERGWETLSRAVAKIEMPVRLMAIELDPERSRPPQKFECDRIVDHLRRRLAQGVPTVGWTTKTHGITFGVVERTARKASLVQVTESRSVDRSHVVEAIEEKVTRYRRAAERLDVPLLVILAAEPRSGLNAPFVEDVLAGKHVMAINFDARTVGPMTPRRQTLLRAHTPPAFDSSLSAVGFLDVRDGHDAEITVWPIADALRKLPPHKPSARIHLK